MNMSPEDLDAFLKQVSPTPLGVVGTLRSDGAPNLTPVWFRWDGRFVRIWTTDTRAWVRNLIRDPRVAFSVQTEDDPYPAAVLYGTARIESGDVPSIRDEIRAITSRYVEPANVEGYVADWPSLRTIVTITPDRIVSWSEGG